MNAFKRARTILLSTFVVYGVLVAGHLGEFWPFSIYPMFSQGGQSWSRVVVREVPRSSGALSWQPMAAEALPGEPYPLLGRGVNANDLASMVSKDAPWSAEKKRALHRLFASQLGGRRLLILRVSGRISQSDSVEVTFVPFALVDADGVTPSPHAAR